MLSTLTVVGLTMAFLFGMYLYAKTKKDRPSIKGIMLKPVYNVRGIVERIDVYVRCDDCKDGDVLCVPYGGRASVEPLCKCTPHFEVVWPKEIS